MKNKYLKPTKEQKILRKYIKEFGERIKNDHEFGIQFLIKMGVLTKKGNRTKRYQHLCIGRAPD